MTHLFLAVPTHSETITTATVGTLFGLQRRLIERGDRVDLAFYSSAVIAELRNIMVHDFMSSTADALLMLDADQGGPPELILKLMDSGHLVSGALYPRRRYDWDRVPSDLGTQNMAAVLRRASSFVGSLDAAEGEPIPYINGFAPARYMGAGMLLIRREAVALLQARFPELEGRGLPPGDGRRRSVWGFFNPLQIDERAGPIQEDYAFCHRWRVGCGQVLWAEIATPVTHVGREVHEGAFIDSADLSREGADEGAAIRHHPLPEAGSAQARQPEYEGVLEAEAIRAEHRGDWPRAALLRNELASRDPTAIKPKLMLVHALIRCGGLHEARDLARLIARMHSGPERLDGVAMLCSAYADIRRRKGRALRLEKWIVRQGGRRWERTAPLVEVAGARLAADIETRAMSGDIDGAVASADRWLGTVEAPQVLTARARALIEGGRVEEAWSSLEASIAGGGADWRMLRMAAWAAGELGIIDQVAERLADVGRRSD